MGQGGTVVIVNATASNWTRSGQHSYQMASWNFPDKIPAWGKATVYVEWQETITINAHDDGGEAEYTLDATGEKFQFQARWPSGSDRKIEVCFTSIQVNGQNLGYTTSLGWNHDGLMNFILTGEPARYYATPVRPKWAWINDISSSSNWLMNPVRTLQTMCMPGSHDSGMWTIGTHTAFGYPCNTQTQTKSVGDQLNLGARYFDLRAVISGGNYVTGHYSNITGSTQGANGQSIESIVNDINTFMDGTPDLVILMISHDFNTDLGQGNYRPFNQGEYNGLLSKLSALRYRYITADNVDLTQIPITSFVGKNKGSVLVICDPDDSTVTLPGNTGFYPIKNFPLYDSYTGTNDLTHMQTDQIWKMGKVKASPTPVFFVLSWTLTQSDQEAGGCWADPTGLTSSILDLAAEANPTIYDKLWNSVTPPVYPNVLYTDNVNDTTNLGLALATNYMLHVRASVRAAVISLRAHANSKIVTADNAGASPLIANRTAAGQWEQFLMITNSDGSVSFQAYADDKIVTADNAGASPLIANRTAIGPWEQFDRIDNADGSVSFRARANGKIVTADNAGASPLIANRTAIGPWEEFDLMIQG
jgi:hypothetical protein